MSISEPAPLRSTVPARLDRRPWTPFHTRMVAGLGAAWILDGLQITISTSSQIGVIASSLVGYGVAAFGVGPLLDHATSLADLYRWCAVAAGAWAVLSFLVARGRPARHPFHQVQSQAGAST